MVLDDSAALISKRTSPKKKRYGERSLARPPQGFPLREDGFVPDVSPAAGHPGASHLRVPLQLRDSVHHSAGIPLNKWRVKNA